VYVFRKRLVHGTMGKSEDWSRVMEELSNSRSVIRPNYIERVAGRNSTNKLAVKDLADEVVTALRAEGKQRFDLVGGSLGAALATRWLSDSRGFAVSCLQQPLNGTIVYFETGRIRRSKGTLSNAYADGPKLALGQHHLPQPAGSATSADDPFSFVQESVSR
jgi:pimeloyl-ACP methyl ester carboxylesterase